MILAERLKELRKSKKITQRELANKLDITERTYQYYESGKTTPPFETLLDLAEYFDVSLDYLMGRTDNSSLKQLISASTWFEIAPTEGKTPIYDAIRSIMSQPEVVSALCKELEKNANEEFKNLKELIPPESIGKTFADFLIEWLEEKRPESKKILDSIVEKVEIVSPDKIIIKVYNHF